MQRRRTGCIVRKAQCLRNTGTIIAPPFGHGALAAIATQHGTTGQGENGGQRMTFPSTAAKVGNRGEELEQGFGLWYYDHLPRLKDFAHTLGAGEARAC